MILSLPGSIQVCRVDRFFAEGEGSAHDFFGPIRAEPLCVCKPAHYKLWDQTMPDNNLEISRRIQEKFEFYFLSLTFVVLGLSIQTSKFGGSLLADGFELMGWACLFVSGVSGLSRMRWIPSAYNVAHVIDTREQNLKEAKIRQHQGEPYVVTSQDDKMPIDDFINRAEKGVEDVKKQFAGLENKNAVKYRLHVWGFAVGLFCLMCSRGLDPALRMAEWVIRSA